MIDNPSVSENLVPEALMLSPDDYEEFEALEFDDSEIVVEEEPVLTLLEAEEKFPSSDGDEEAFAILPLEIEEPETNVTDEFSEEPEIAFLLEPSSMKPPESSSDVVPETSSEEEKTDKSDLLPDFLDVSDVSEKVEVAEKFPKTASLKGLNETSHEKLENAVVVSLEKGEYLQIGAFSQSKPLLNNYERISNTYPLSLVPVEKNEKVLYKLLVGPLNEDEKGLILIQFKDMGYKDAFFIRR